jgi:hypothetical protein
MEKFLFSCMIPFILSLRLRHLHERIRARGDYAIVGTVAEVEWSANAPFIQQLLKFPMEHPEVVSWSCEPKISNFHCVPFSSLCSKVRNVVGVVISHCYLSTRFYCLVFRKTNTKENQD